MKLKGKAFLSIVAIPMLLLLGGVSQFKHTYLHTESHREGIQKKESVFDLIKSDTVIILESDTVYELYAPVLIENVNNFTLRGNGATLRFMFNGKGLNIKGCSNIVLTNLVIDNDNGKFKSGANEGRINIESTAKAVVDSIIMQKQSIRSAEGPNHQIVIYFCKESSLLHSVFEESQGELIMLKSSENCVISQNKTTGGWSGIATAGDNIAGVESYGYRNKILDNEVKNATAALITINDRDALVEGNVIHSTIKKNGEYVGGPGIRFGHFQDKDNKLLNHLRAVRGKAIENKIFNFTQATAPKFSIPYAIKVDATVSELGEGGVTITGNEINNCRYGIGVSNQGGQSGIIEDNDLRVLEYAISLYSAKRNSPHNFIIRNNAIKNSENAYAMRLWYSSAEVVGNTIEMRSRDGQLYAIGIANNTDNERVKIIGNRLHLNGTIGVYQINGYVNKESIQGNKIEGTKSGVVLKEMK